MQELKSLDKKNTVDILGLTPMQEGLLFHYLKDPGAAHYFEQLSLEVSGAVDIGCFEQAWNFVIETNEMLRTKFRWKNIKNPLQIILKKHRIKLRYYDISIASSGDGSEKKTGLEKIKTEDRKEKFDLREVPFRVTLCKIADHKFEIIISNHHILYDGWSNGIILKEFFHAYHNLSRGKPLEPLVKTGFKEFLKEIQTRDTSEESIFWQEYLRGFDFPTGIPVKKSSGGRDNKKKKEGEFDARHIRLTRYRKEKLQELVKRYKITFAALLYSAWGLLLQKYTNSGDVVFGTTVSGRKVKIEGIEEMVGLFINTLPLRVQTEANEKTAIFLQRVNRKLQERELYEATSLVNIKEYCDIGGEEKLFDTLVVMENYPLDFWLKQESTPLSLSVDSYSMEEQTHYNLTVSIKFFDDIDISFFYTKELFDRETIVRLSRHFLNILQSIEGDAERDVHQLDILSAEEKRQLLIDFNDTEEEYPKDKVIHQLFEEQVEKLPDNIAVTVYKVGSHCCRKASKSVVENIYITYSELNKKSAQLSQRLRGKGVKPGTIPIMGIMVERSLEMILGILAILKSGGAYLPIDPTYPPDRIHYMLDDSNVGVLLTTPKLRVKVKAEVTGRFIEIIDISNLSSFSTSTSTCQVSPTKLAYVIYTSGSTGKPKGVLVQHGSVVNILLALFKKYPLLKEDTCLLKTTYTFDVSVSELFGWYLGGGRLVVLAQGSEKDPQQILDTLVREGISHVNFVPSMFNMFLEVLEVEGVGKLSRLKYIFLAGEALFPDLVRRFNRLKLNAGAVLENIYGPTEGTIYVSQYSLPEWEGCGNIPIGKPLPNIKLHILNKHHHLQPIGVPGELCISGVGLTRGYLNRTELTAEKFIDKALSSLLLALMRTKRAKNPLRGRNQPGAFRETLRAKSKELRAKLYKTGDLARWLSDGNIEFLGRMDFQVKIRGFRIELGEIENQLVNFEGVKEAVVIVRTDETGENVLCAYVVPFPVGELQAQQISYHLQQKLPHYMIPSYFVQLERIPLTPTGKVDRRALPDPGIDIGDNYVAPRDEIERGLVEIWSGVLGIEREKISIDDSFFHLGGHSLRAAVLVSRIHRELNISIPLGEIFKTSTSHIRGLAAYIKQSIQSGVDKHISIKPVEKKAYYVLSSAQARLYILQQMDKQGIGYNMSSVWQVEGNIDIDKLEKVFQQLVRRHESLRTSFHMLNGEAVQRIHNEVNLEIKYYDMKEVEVKVEEEWFSVNRKNLEGTRGLAPLPTELANAISNPQPATALITSFIRSFDLSQTPLFRVGLIKIEEEQYLLMVDMHHIIADGISVGVFIKEFMAIYGGKKLSPLRIQYKDFSEWQRHPGQKEKIDKQKDYWLEQWADEIPVLNLPTDYPRPLIQGFEGYTLSIELDQNESFALKSLARKQDITLFMLLLCAYTIFLFKLADQEDIVVGTPTAGRCHADLENIIGMFVNTLALRNFPIGQKPFIDLLAEVKERTLEAFENQDYPFEDLVEQVVVERDTSRNPLFDTMFVLQNVDTPIIEIPGLKIAPFEYESRTAKFDLTLTAVEGGERLCFIFEYSTRLFKKETIERFIHYFKKILAAFIENERIKPGEIEIITGEEKQKLLYDFNDTAARYPKGKTLHQLFAEQVERTPDHTALVGQSAERKMQSEEEKRASVSLCAMNFTITYRQLNEKSNQLAYLLKEKGVVADTIVGIMVERAVEIITGIWGILKAGGAYLPIDPDYPEERIEFMLKDSNTKILVTSPNLSEKFEKLSIVNCQFLMVNETASNRLNISPKKANKKSQLERSNLAYIIYTSGTTGTPKGVIIENKHVVRLLFNDRFQFDFHAGDVWTLFHSICFDFSVWEMYGALLFGGRLVIIPQKISRDIPGYLEILKKEKVTILNQTPSAFYHLIEAELNAPRGNLNLRYVIFGGEALKPGKLNQWTLKYPKAKLVNMFGITETTVHVTYKEIRDEEIHLNISNIGKPIPTLSAYVMDSNLKLLPIGVAGECCVGGEGVARGYLNRPLLTREKFIENPYNPGEKLYRSGDLVRFLANGEIEYLGRIDHQVKIRGFRIELGEIETYLLNFPGVSEAVVIAREANEKDKYLCAYIRVREDEAGSIEPAVLRDHLSNHLPDYMIPSYFVHLKKVPLTSSGKVDRKALPGPKIEVGDNYVAPRDEIEKRLAVIWSEVLGVTKEKISIDDSFFHLGGHSLRAAVLVSRIHRELNISIPLGEIFKTSTSHIRGLAAYIKQSIQSGVDKHISIEPGEEKEYYLLSSAQARLYILQQMDRQGIEYNMPAVWQVEGKVDIEKLERVFYQLIHRHESLRTSFHMLNDEAVLRVHGETVIGHWSLVIGETDKSDKSEITGIINNFVKPFDLSRAPLLRVELIKLLHTPSALRAHPRRGTYNSQEGNMDKYLLMVDMHHIISDGISVSVFIKDFMDVYGGKELSPLRIRYKDFSAWQRHPGQQEKINKQKAYWLEQWSDEIPVLNLSTDYPRPSLQSFAGNTLPFELDEKESRALKSLAREQSVTLFMLLLSLYTIFLSKLSGQEDIAVGIPGAGRRHADLENIMGMFVNTLALRNFPTGQKPFALFLEEVKTRTLEAFENQDYPFADLVEQVNVQRDTSRNPLFDTMFALQNIDAPIIEIPGLKLVPFRYEMGISKFDLILMAVEAGEKLSFTFEYSTRLFKEETIERFTNYFKKILLTVIEDNTIKLSEIEIIPGEEKRKILYDFNKTTADYSRDKTVHQLFEEQVEQTPGHLALKENYQLQITNKKAPPGENIQLSYKELDEKSNHLAHLLKEKGVLTDTIIGLIMEASINMVIGIFAILKAGAAYLPIDLDVPPQRINYMLADSGAKIVITTSEMKDTKRKIDFEREMVYISSLYQVSSAVEKTCPKDAGFHGQLAYVIYTSGSTGVPKGVMVDHCALVNLCTWHNRFFRVTSRDRASKYAAVGFDASVWETFPYLLAGAALYLVPDGVKPDMAGLNRYLETHGITIAFLPTPVCEQFMELENHCLRLLLTGGDRLKSYTKGNYRLFNNYGPTENTVVATTYLVGQPPDNIPIGKPIHNNRIFIICPGYSHLQPIGVAGELCIGGEGLARGYLNKPELTCEKFKIINYNLKIKNGSGTLRVDLNAFSEGEVYELHEKNNKKLLWGVQGGGFLEKRSPGRRRHPSARGPYKRTYKTGDLARWLADGNIEFLGRLDFQVKIRGFRIELGEIETHLLNFPGINEAVVIARETNEKDKCLCAYIRVKEDEAGSIEPAVLRDHLSNHLPDYMIPSYFVHLEKVPLTSSGKVDRKALPGPKIEVGDNYAAPRDEIEMRLVGIWSKVLGIEAERIGIDDSFFHLGGHSLKINSLLMKIHKAFDVKLPMVEVFKIPRIRQLAKYINGLTRDKYVSVESVEKKDYYELSSTQRRLYILQQMESGHTTSYNMPYVISLEKEIDKEKLEAAFKKLIARHESLRTSFEMVLEKPVQRVHNRVNFAIDYFDAEGLAYDEGRKRVQEIIANFERPFDLSRAPLIRLRLVKTVEDKHLLLLDMHHIITDGTSQNILEKEFQVLLSGQELVPLRLHYKDYSEWQNSQAWNELVKDQQAFWLQEFSRDNELPVLNLPTDYPRPLVQSFEGSSVHFVLTGEESRALRHMAQEIDGTLFMCILSVYTVLLSKLSGHEDIIVGTPIAARRHADIEHIVGMFANTLAMRNYPSGEKTFKEFLIQVKERTLKAFENQDYPFEDLVEQLSVPRDTGRNPIFDVMFNLLNRSDPGDSPGKPVVGVLGGDEYEQRKRTSKFDLNLTAMDNNGKRLYFDFEYCTKLFNAGTIERMIGYFRRIVSLLSVNPGLKLADLEIMMEAEKAKVLEISRGVEEALDIEQTTHGWFEDQALKSPDSIALVMDLDMDMDMETPVPSFLSYRELNARANHLARELMSRGVTSDMVVGLMVERSFEMIIAILAILKAGGAYLPIDHEYPLERKNYMLKDSQVKLLLTNHDTEPLPGAVGEEIEMINIDDEGIYYRDISNPKPINTGANLLYVIYTSGSTGKPKGVMLEHRNLVNLIRYQYQYTHIDFSRVLQFTTIGFDVSAQEIFSTLLAGGRLSLIDKETRNHFPGLCKVMERDEIKTLFLAAAYLKFIFKEKEYIELISPSVKHIVAAGEMLIISNNLREYLKSHHVYLHNHYGPSETHVVTALTLDPAEEIPDLPSIGKPILNTSIFILDSHRHLLPAGAAGELYIGGIQVGRGYRGNEQLTAERFIANPFAEGERIYKTGDLARWLWDGNLEFLGRIDHQVKIRGFRVELGEIESHLLKRDEIKEAVVVAKAVGPGDNDLCAYMISDIELSVSELRGYLSQFLPGYMVPSYFVWLDKLPLTPNGKVDRKALPEPEFKTGKNYAAPGSDIEKKLVKIWSEVLDVHTPIGIDDNFFELGGHSLRGIGVVSKIHKEFNIKVPLAEIFKNSTIQGLSGYIKRAEPGRYVSIVPVEKKEYFALSSTQKRLYMLQQMKTDTTVYNMPNIVILEGEVDGKKLEKVFRQLINRHESFRTSFEMIEKEPVQRIHDDVEFEIEYYDFQVSGSGDRCRWEDEGTRGLAPLPIDNASSTIKNFIRPFDLARAPLLRVGLIELQHTPAAHQKENSASRYILILDMHHIISDGTSQDIFRKEFMAFYEKEDENGKEKLPGLKIQYKDYSCWENSENKKESLEIQEVYWLKEFKGEIPVFNLPLDFARPEVQGFAGSVLYFKINEGESRVLKKIAFEQGVSLFVLLLAIYNILISKVTGRHDILVGTQVAGRRHAELQNIMGVFINTLVLRNYPHKEKTFRAFVNEVMERTIKAFENQEYPFEELVENVLGKREVNRNPFFDVMFVWQNMEQNEIKIPGLTLKPYKYEEKTRALIDLSLYGYEQGKNLIFLFEYNISLFKKNTIQRFITYFKEIVSFVVADIEVKLQGIKISHDLGRAKQNMLKDEDDAFGF